MTPAVECNLPERPGAVCRSGTDHAISLGVCQDWGGLTREWFAWG